MSDTSESVATAEAQLSGQQPTITISFVKTGDPETDAITGMRHILRYFPSETAMRLLDYLMHRLKYELHQGQIKMNPLIGSKKPYDSDDLYKMMKGLQGPTLDPGYTTQPNPVFPEPSWPQQQFDDLKKTYKPK